MAVVAAMGLTSYKNDTKSTETNEKTEVVKEIAMAETNFGVRGNCGMCKSTIEKAANGVEGVASATWDRDKKSMHVSFDDAKTNEMDIQTAVAASGYDTEKVEGDMTAYDGLPGCCKYDHDMEMNQSGGAKSDDHSEEMQ